jgi:hypothetical protein
MRAKNGARRVRGRAQEPELDPQLSRHMASVLLQRSALVHILAAMTRRQAARLATTCKLFREAYAAVLPLGLEHAPSLLIAASGTSTLLELDPDTHHVSRRCALSINKRRSSSDADDLLWATSIVAHRGVVYASQYQVCSRRATRHAPSPRLRGS